MRFQRFSAPKAQIHIDEHVDVDVITLWQVPHHGYFPSLEIAIAVARGHQSSQDIKAVEFAAYTKSVVQL